MVLNVVSPSFRPGGTASPEKRRPKIAAMETGPGPAVYCLPGTCGRVGHDASRHQSPAFSFGVKTKQSSSVILVSHSPGPVHFVSPSITRRGKDGTAAYSIYGRPKDLRSAKTPGPCAYHAEKAHPPQEKHAPAYSFGKRTHIPSRHPTPSPSAYTLPSLIGPNTIGKKSVPAYSMTGRPKVGGFAEDLRKTPPPGSYGVVDSQVYRTRSPSYSMLGRNFPPEDHTKKPDPGTYSPEKVSVNRKQSPSYSFGIKHSEYIAPVLKFVV